MKAGLTPLNFGNSVIIPHAELEKETLLSLVEEFVTRDGTNYGEFELSLEEKSQQMLAKLNSGEAVILFSESTGQCNIVAKQSLEKPRS